MTIERINHISIRVADLESAQSFFSQILDTEFTNVGQDKELDIQAALDPNGIELVSPVSDEGPVAKAIENQGEGLAVLSFKVSCLDKTLARLNAQGVRVVQTKQLGEARVALTHPNDSYGVMMEFVEYKERHPMAEVLENI
jgi:methylmalonyl-CoA/ethylmalonyl-CoA epimerase